MIPDMTIKKIAEIAGVHESTVSRALANSKLVKSETRERIQKIADETGYCPNVIAKSLTMNKTNMIGLLIPDFMTTFYAEITNGIEYVCMERDYNVIFGRSDFDSQKERQYLQYFQQRQVDGLIICAFHYQENFKFLTQLNKRNKAVVLLDTPFDEWEDVSNFHLVEVDNILGVGEAIKHLYDLGHRDIAFVSDSVTTSQRFEG